MGNCQFKSENEQDNIKSKSCQLQTGTNRWKVWEVCDSNAVEQPNARSVLSLLVCQHCHWALLHLAQLYQGSSIGLSLNEFEPNPFCIEISKSDFISEYVIGRGGFGKVWKVQLKKNQQMFAMKEMLKARVIAKRSVHSVMNEKKFLSQLYHP